MSNPGPQHLISAMTAANFIPVPGIAIAAGVALLIINIVQTMRNNNDEFTSLGRDLCVTVAAIIERVNIDQAEQSTPTSPTMNLQQDVDQLVFNM
ncbi:hypothetical protein P691DRAFT_765841 [Macrolepiota fuliginosa MF-IS2]|uniref:Uncharacterized protein n=1 Tax=Macrolepiota fuliginosa MF-IS2 TaxID=1400762 RepID=A0A9P5X083_9AGAR|nr:hypothetical protein P691DRAFT_765841 [Macrolepiota fuliginosa MF-IS2]